MAAHGSIGEKSGCVPYVRLLACVSCRSPRQYFQVQGIPGLKTGTSPAPTSPGVPPPRSPWKALDAVRAFQGVKARKSPQSPYPAAPASPWQVLPTVPEDVYVQLRECPNGALWDELLEANPMWSPGCVCTLAPCTTHGITVYCVQYVCFMVGVGVQGWSASSVLVRRHTRCLLPRAPVYGPSAARAMAGRMLLRSALMLPCLVGDPWARGACHSSQG